MTVVSFKDLADLMNRLRAAGGDLRFDGWKATLYGKNLPADLLEELRDAKLQLIYAAVMSWHFPCPCCGGVGKHEWEGFSFCTEHNPSMSLDLKMLAGMNIQRLSALKHIQQARDDHDQPAIEICTDEYHRICDSIDKFEKEHLNGQAAHADTTA